VSAIRHHASNCVANMLSISVKCFVEEMFDFIGVELKDFDKDVWVTDEEVDFIQQHWHITLLNHSLEVRVRMKHIVLHQWWMSLQMILDHILEAPQSHTKCFETSQNNSLYHLGGSRFNEASLCQNLGLDNFEDRNGDTGWFEAFLWLFDFRHFCGEPVGLLTEHTLFGSDPFWLIGKIVNDIVVR